MANILLSAALIVRNEETFLDGCLESLRGRVDEIVVVDTGSTDRSRDIALARGARVLDFPWRDDFAAARNASIEAARGQWILYIDADERLVEFDRSEAEHLFGDPTSVAYTVLFRPQQGYTRYREYRLFRNRPDLRFRGVMHETLLPALKEICREGSWRIGESQVALDHLGYEGDLRRKHERNLPLLRARLADDPLHVYSWDHLGKTLLALDDFAGAETAWLRGIEIVRTLGVAEASDSLPYLHLANHLLDGGRDASALLEEACGRFTGNHSLTWLRARALLESGQCAEAMPLFAALAEIRPDSLDGGCYAFDASIFGANAHAALGLCALRLEHYAESAAHFARAEALAPANLEFRGKRLFAEIKAKAAGEFSPFGD